MNMQNNNGRAFEWAIATEFKRNSNLAIKQDAYANMIAKIFNQINELKKYEFLKSACIAVNHLLIKEKITKTTSGNILFNNDQIGQYGDTRNLIISINKRNIGILCKNNHVALKHPRLSRTNDFIKKCGIDDNGCSK